MAEDSVIACAFVIVSPSVGVESLVRRSARLQLKMMRTGKVCCTLMLRRDTSRLIYLVLQAVAVGDDIANIILSLLRCGRISTI